MGLYDEVVFQCPKCEEGIMVQSKAGQCQLKTIGCGEVPYGIAGDIDGEVVTCDNCDKTWIVFQPVRVGTIQMGLRPLVSGEG